MNPQPTPGAIRAAEIIIAEETGRPSTIRTAYGVKTRVGIADLIDRETGTAELLAALKLCEKALTPSRNDRDLIAADEARAAIAKAEGHA